MFIQDPIPSCVGRIVESGRAIAASVFGARYGSGPVERAIM
jgi:hypothetical protein